MDDHIHKLDVLCIPCVLNLNRKYEKLLNFVRDIVKHWECDLNHAESLLKEIKEIEENN